MKLFKPGVTRWSSKITAGERVCVLAQPLSLLTPQAVKYWEDLGKVLDFLRPFRVATDSNSIVS